MHIIFSKSFKWITLILLSVLSFPLFSQNPAQVVKFKSDGAIPNQYIVQFHSEITQGSNKANIPVDLNLLINQKAKAVLQANGINSEPKDVFSSFSGFVVQMNEQQMRKLKNDPNIKHIEEDFAVSVAFETQSGISTLSTQTENWGVRHTGRGDGTGKTVWVLDTGIDFNHPDLNVDVSRAYFHTSVGTSANDGHGHGTHVAGIIGAKDNGFGIVGVAANATLVPVKVLSNTGGGSISSILGGINYIALNGNPGDVVNISLGTANVSSTMETAVKNLGAAGMFVAIAAGNSNIHANGFSPARATGTNLYTISSIDENGSLSSFSNYGNPPVAFAAPGSGILSTMPNNSYGYMSGTSMAAPHVAGILALNNGVIKSQGVALNDKDTVPDPLAVLYHSVDVDLKVLLQGPFNTVTGSMNTNLVSNNLLPLQQPYNVPKINYTGNESVASSFFSSNPTIVDWVLLELRTDSTSSSAIARTAAFVKSDGTLIGIDGKKPQFTDINSGNYHVAIYHRNHFTVVSSTPVSLIRKNSSAFNFITSPNPNMVNLGNGKLGMVAGNMNRDRIINASDRVLISRNLNSNASYSIYDVNLDGLICPLDHIIITNNLGKINKAH